MKYFAFLFVFLLSLHYMREGYTNYRELSYGAAEQNCPQEHANSFQKLKTNYQTIQPFGYTRNELFDITRFIKTDIPLPVDPDFFKHL